MDKGGVVVVGENHASPTHHRLQLEVIRALHQESIRETGKPPLAIGLEMFYRQHQPLLDRYVFSDQLVARYNSSFEYGIQDLERDTEWEKTWGYDINSGYSKIFAFAKKNGIRLVGLNIPAQVVQLVRDAGIRQIDPNLRALLPQGMDFANEKHRTRFDETMAEMESIGVSHMGVKGATAYASDMGGVDGAEEKKRVLQNYYECEVLWDEYCAETAARYFESCAKTEEGRGVPGSEGAKLIILAGSSHVCGRDGIPDRIARRLQSDYSRALPFRPFTIVPRGVSWVGGSPDLGGSGKLPSTEVADWVWYTQKDEQPIPRQEISRSA
jgi:hypothetical protein